MQVKDGGLVTAAGVGRAARPQGGAIGPVRTPRVGRGVPAGAREEIVCDAITAITLSPHEVQGEQHPLADRQSETRMAVFALES
jgi:hypothetical protein